MSIFEPTPTGDEAIDVVFKRLQQAMRGQATDTAADIAAGDAEAVAAAGVASQQARGLFFQTFEDPVEDDWNVREGTPTITYPNNGVVGGKALRTDGHLWMAYPGNIPFDPARLYRFRARVRQISAPTDPAKDIFYFGFEGIAADGVTLVSTSGSGGYGNAHYAGSVSSWVNDVWVEKTGYYKGTAAAGTQGGATPQLAGVAHENVRYMRPNLILNYNGGDGVFELDYIAIEVITEDLEIDAQEIVDGDLLVAANQAASVFGQPFSAATIASLMSGSAITEVQIEDDAITSPKIAANQILAGHILAGEIDASKIAANTILAGNIAAGTITGDEIAAATILAGNIAADQITSGLIAADQILASHIAAGQVDTGQLAAGAVTAVKIEANAIVAGKISAGAVEAGDIAAGAISTSNLFVAGVVGNAALGPDSVDSGEIANGAINAGTMISGGVIATGHMSAGSIDADRLSAGTVDTTQLAAGAITAAKIDALAVIAGKIAAGAVDTNELAAYAVQAGKIEAGAIIAGKIAVGGVSGSTQIGNGVVNTNQLAAGAVEAAKIDAGAITAGKIAVGGVSGSTQIANGIVDTLQLAADSVIATKIDVADLSAISLDISNDLWVPNNKTIKYGTSGGGASPLVKSAHVPYTAFHKENYYTQNLADQGFHSFSAPYCAPYVADSGNVNWVAQLVLPYGVKITSIKVTGYRANSSQLNTIFLHYYGGSGPLYSHLRQLSDEDVHHGPYSGGASRLSPEPEHREFNERLAAGSARDCL
jgi:hypothetical protein